MALKRSFIIVSLMQCGQTQWEREERVHGASDLPLSNAGRAAASGDAQGLAGIKAPTVYHPPDEAAAETAKIIGGFVSGRARVVEELADPNLGILEGLHLREFEDRYPKRFKQWEEDPLSLIPPEGEPFADARQRVFRAVAKVLKKSRAEEVPIVLHPVALGLLRCWMADRPATAMWHMLKVRPRIERYLLSTEVIEQLRQAAAPVSAES